MGDPFLVSRTTLTRYYKIGLDKKKRTEPPANIPMILINTMRLHDKVLQLSKQGQASGSSIKHKLTAATMGTEHKGFDSDWAWR